MRVDLQVLDDSGQRGVGYCHAAALVVPQGAGDAKKSKQRRRRQDYEDGKQKPCVQTFFIFYHPLLAPRRGTLEGGAYPGIPAGKILDLWAFELKNLFDIHAPDSQKS